MKQLSAPVFKILLVLIILLPLYSVAGEIPNRIIADRKSADYLEQLWAQDGKGRYKPINTVALELSQKLTGKKQFEGLAPEQLLVSIAMYSQQWKSVRLIKLPKGSLPEILGIEGGYASYNDFFDKDGVYKLDVKLAEINKKGMDKNAADRAIVSATEKLNIFMMIARLDFFKVFPDKNNPQTEWLSPSSDLSTLPKEDSLFIKNIFYMIFESIKSKNHKRTFELVSAIGKYQQKIAGGRLPSHFKRKTEIAYNTYNHFSLLFKLYMVVGLIIMFLFISGKNIERLHVFIKSLLFVFIISHTFLLGLRTYIAGHAPFSNGYEIMLSLGWLGIVTAGLVVRKKIIVSSASLIFASLCLLVADLNWMNPEITTLMPVLKSNWLSIHVSAMMLAYAFAGIAALVAFICVIMVLFASKSRIDAVKDQLVKLTVVNEILLWVCVYATVLGVIFGAVWANESWGKYWSWDPKETWALISLMIYSLLVHSYKKGNRLLLQFFTICAFTSILFTYFGVNYFLGGKHSYAGEADFEIPVYIAVILLLFLGAFAFSWHKAKRLELV